MLANYVSFVKTQENISEKESLGNLFHNLCNLPITLKLNSEVYSHRE